MCILIQGFVFAHIKIVYFVHSFMGLGALASSLVFISVEMDYSLRMCVD